MRISEKPAPDGHAAALNGLSGPSVRKLPVPPRERKPALAALAVFLILIGSLGATLLVMRTGDRVSAVRIVEQVGAGEKIPASAIQEVQIADTGVDFVSWQYSERVTETYAAVTLLPGTLLTEQMVSESSAEVGPGKAIVGLALKDGQMPLGLVKGDVVQVIYVPSGGKDATSRQTTGSPQRVLSTNALVTRVGASDDNTSNGLISVVVDSTVAPTVAMLASSGEVAVIAIPGAK
ncbi:hypothetical protein Pth03_15940 [Planotetraspora thailandica]|uniref:SAF domain-containing protein n=1 Tax=Planotetraspora thailandica TaxID=487172 RepID=A0A8J3VAJ9_9ACTN|nr:hypothetical protein [Planotetraspora thailandica]GII53205.1 hypothetical protein Pth03_15940 [Planotetraspora thailandica]